MIEAIWVVVGQSFGGFTATLVADRLPVDALVFVTAMIPALGERSSDWFANTGCSEAVAVQAQRDGGQTGSDDPLVVFYNGVPRALAEEALSKGRSQSETPGQVACPLDEWPDVPTKFVLCTDDHFFPPDFMRRVVSERLGITPDEIAAGHCVALGHPRELAAMLVGYAAAHGPG